MLNEIVKGIAKKLSETFDYKIYKENIPQGFEKPCFYIQHVQTFNSKKLANRYLRQNYFDVMYYPKDSYKENSEIYDVTEKLFLCLEEIFVLDNLVRGVKMSPEIVDGVLHFFVNYDMFVKRPETNTKDHMQTLNSNQEWRNQ